MKATEQYFLMVLFSLLSMVFLTVDSVNQILKCWTIQMKAAEQYFPLLLFFMLYKVPLTLKSLCVNEIL